MEPGCELCDWSVDEPIDEEGISRYTEDWGIPGCRLKGDLHVHKHTATVKPRPTDVIIEDES